MTRAALRNPATDYYGVLGVVPTASAEQIRSSFKRLMIQSHPDKNPGRRAWSEQRVRELIRAYEILGDPRNREEFDRRRRITVARSPGARKVSRPFFFYRKDPESRALLVLHLLLHRQHSEAILVLAEMEAELGTDFLLDNLDRKDYLDCLFLLGEYHLGKREYTAATQRLSAFHAHDSRARFPRHYGDQVIEMLKDLYLRKLPRCATAETVLAGLREVAHLGLSSAEEGLRLRKMTEVLIALGDLEGATAAANRVRDHGGACQDVSDLFNLVEGARRRGQRRRED